MLRYGIPCEFCADFGSVYHAKKYRLTDVSRALSKLGVNVIHAHSPQAKFRVELSNRTHQDRLGRLSDETLSPPSSRPTPSWETPTPRSTTPAFPRPDHLPHIHRTAEGVNLHSIFCFETTRYVHRDYTITFSAHYIQLLTSEVLLPPPCHHVTPPMARRLTPHLLE